MRLYRQVFTIFFFLSLYLFNKSYAQLCQGSLGDPVVNITFGSGSNPGPQLTSTLTNYSFVPYDCPNDGSYTIANSTANCFESTWFSLSEDHTPGDVNGYMMVVNASYDPGDFYVQQVDGLCENTTYEFAAWMLNIIKPSACGGITIQPNVTFDIETAAGTVLQSFKTGDIPPSSPEWKQYGLFFTTPAGVSSVVIRMTNNAPGGCGNDIILDDITFRPCGPLVTATIDGASKEANICTGNSGLFALRGIVSSGYNNPVYQWQISTDKGATWKNISGADKTTYSVLSDKKVGVYQYRLSVAQSVNVSTSSCSVVSDVVSINVNPIPVPAISNSGPVCTKETLKLQASGGSTYSWNGPQGFSSNVQEPAINNVQLNNSGKYYVNVTSDKGCINIDSTVVVVYLSPVIDAGSDVGICEGKSTRLSGSGDNIISYTWNPSSSLSDGHIANPIASPSQTTLYILTGTNGTCKNTDSVTVNVDKKPTANAGPDQVIINGQYATLKGRVSGQDITYHWSPDLYLSSSTALTPVINLPHDTSYILNVTSNIGCGTAADTVLIKVYNDLYIPNAFTPDNDGKNDTWNIETLKAYPGAEVKVYNRYGEIIFNNRDIKNGWDGKYKGVLQDAGAYCYIIDLKNGSKPITGVVIVVL